MPTVLRVGPYRFFFYSADGNEPRHIHVDRDDKEAKFWLDPMVHLAFNHGFSRGELRGVLRIIRARIVHLRRSWDDFFNP